MTCQGFIGKADERFWRIAMSENAKLQITNIKWFDKPFGRLTVLSQVEGLTTLSQVEGQITMTNPPPADQTCHVFWSLNTCPVEFRRWRTCRRQDSTG